MSSDLMLREIEGEPRILDTLSSKLTFANTKVII